MSVLNINTGEDEENSLPGVGAKWLDVIDVEPSNFLGL